MPAATRRVLTGEHVVDGRHGDTLVLLWTGFALRWRCRGRARNAGAVSPKGKGRRSRGLCREARVSGLGIVGSFRRALVF